MLRRSSKKCADLNNEDHGSNRSRRSSRNLKRSHSARAVSTYTVFGACALSIVLCLTIQTRLFDDKLQERKTFTAPINSPPVSKDDYPKFNRNVRQPAAKRKEVESPPAVRSGVDKRTMYDGNTNALLAKQHKEEEDEDMGSPSMHHEMERDNKSVNQGGLPSKEGEGVVGNDIAKSRASPSKHHTEDEHNESPNVVQPSRNIPPRIVHYDNSHFGTLELRHQDLLSNDAPNRPSSASSETKSTTNEGTMEDKMSAQNATEVDDEDSGVEDKNSIQIPGETADECVPMAYWQSSTPVNCNTIHEIDLLSSILNTGKPTSRKKLRQAKSHVNITTKLHHQWERHPAWNESQIKFLGQGWFREAWKLDRQPPSASEGSEADKDDETLILKMLRPERDFTAEFYELHRIDAVAMEQLTHSKFVLDIYGYCGQSALNEFASFRIPELSSLEKFDRQLRGKDSPKINRMKLKLAISVATGVAHVHELPADIIGDDRPAMAHYDLNPRNVAIVQGGMPKLNDFNVAHLLKYNPKTNLTCGFDSRLHEPWWRAPEEVSLNGTGKLTHSVDVWSLGNLLFHILTTHSPRGKMKDYRMESVRQDVLKGIPPPLPKEYAESKDASVAAFRRAMRMCFVKDPQERASARDVANVLFEAYLNMVEAEKDREKKKHH